MICPCCGQEAQKFRNPKLLIRQLTLSNEQQRMMLFLAGTFGFWVNSSDIAKAIWGADMPASSQMAIRAAVYRMRPLLVASPFYVESRPGRSGGYRLTWRIE